MLVTNSEVHTTWGGENQSVASMKFDAELAACESLSGTFSGRPIHAAMGTIPVVHVMQMNETI